MAAPVHDTYQLGRYFTAMPIPPIPEHCIALDAGPVRLVVEARQLNDRVIGAHMSTQADDGRERPDTSAVDDFGATLHVYGADDDLEHLRFDCFAKEPHYHYVRNADHGNLVCRIDQYAEGDPIEWTLGRLRSRLPEMLEFAGVPELAARTRAEHTKVLAVVDEIEALLGQARERADAEHVAVA
jgi:hypothetical protein